MRFVSVLRLSGSAFAYLAQVARFKGARSTPSSRPGDDRARAAFFSARELGAVWTQRPRRDARPKARSALIFAPVGALVSGALRGNRQRLHVVLRRASILATFRLRPVSLRPCCGKRIVPLVRHLRGATRGGVSRAWRRGGRQDRRSRFSPRPRPMRRCPPARRRRCAALRCSFPRGASPCAPRAICPENGIFISSGGFGPVRRTSRDQLVLRRTLRGCLRPVEGLDGRRARKRAGSFGGHVPSSGPNTAPPHEPRRQLQRGELTSRRGENPS